jgi:NADPH2:quinone reductase
MRAAVLGETGVEIREVPRPVPQPDEVLIKVRASSLNRADLLVASGHQHGRVGGVGARLGLECAGEVVAVGPEAVKKATDDKGVDLIVDQVSAGVANQNMAAAILGRIVNVGRLGGMKGAFNYDLQALKRIDYIGVTCRTRSPAEVRQINRLMRADLWDAVEAGRLTLPIDRTFALAQVADALA